MTLATKVRPDNHRGMDTIPLPETATVQDLLRARADLPISHPDRATLRDRGIEAGLPLARHLANRYRNRGESMDDLHQVAALALIKAVDAFDVARQVPFTSYATPCILGALKRHFRDCTWQLRVPRPIQDLAVRLGPARARLAQELGRSPTVPELAVRLDASELNVNMASAAWRAYRPDSLDAPPAGSAEQPRPLVDILGALDSRLDTVIDLHAVRPLIAALPDRERHILALRYFHDLTQTEIATEVGISQMHVSRLLERTLTQLRTGMVAGRFPTHQTVHNPARSEPVGNGYRTELASVA